MRLRRNLAGGILVLVGLAGLVLPVIPGILFLLVGLVLLDWPGREKLAMRARRLEGFARLEAWLERYVGEGVGGPSAAEASRPPDQPTK